MQLTLTCKPKINPIFDDRTFVREFNTTEQQKRI